MSLTDSIKKSLGIPTDTKIGKQLKDDTYDNTPGPHSEVDLAAAGPTTNPAASFEDLDDLDDEPLTEEEAIAAAAEKLEALELQPGSWSLIDRALDSMSRNTGAGLEDADAALEAKQRALLVKATDNDLQSIVSAIISSSPALDAAGNVYSILYACMKNCVFFANLDYQMAQGMDSFSDEATVQAFFDRYVSTTYVDEALSRVVDGQSLSADDEREKEQEDKQRSDQGFEARREIELDYLKEKYAATDVEDAVVQALSDIQMLFQLTVESLGWDASRPMPFNNVRNADGVTFTPINDAKTAIEAAEIARQASQKKRREKRSSMLAGALAAAQAATLKGLQRPTVHQKK